METLAVVEILGRRGEVFFRERIHRFPAIVGRAFDADVIVDDEFVDSHHLKIESSDEGGFLVTALDADNKFSIIGRSNAVSQDNCLPVAPGEVLRFGHSQIRIWRPDSPVPSVTRYAAVSKGSGVQALFMTLLAVFLITANALLELTGSGRDGQIGLWALLTLLLIVGWSGVWWVCGRQSKDGASFFSHMNIAATSIVLLVTGCYTIESLVFAFGLYFWSLISPALFMFWVVLIYAVWRHLRLISRMKSWVLGSIAFLCVSLLMVSNIYIDAETSRYKIGELSLPSMMRPPWMRIVEGVSPEDFLEKSISSGVKAPLAIDKKI